MVRPAQAVHLSCSDTNTLNGLTMRFHLTHLTLEFYRVCPKWFLSLWYVRHKSCTYLASRLALSLNGSNQASTWACHLGELSGVFKTTSKPIVRLAQTMHQSCSDTKTISPRCSTGLVQNDFWACGMFSAKPCTYHASRLALSRNEQKWASTWASSPRSTIGCVQNDFWVYGMFGANHAPILQQY
jgi:hypothetical protein